MKKLVIIVIVLLGKSCFSQRHHQSICEVNIDSRNLSLDRKKAELLIYKYQSNDVQKSVIIKSIKNFKEQIKINFKIDTPFMGYFILKYFDTLIDQSSYLYFSNEFIKCVITRNDGIRFDSKQNIFLKNNRFYLFSPPGKLTSEPGFRMNLSQRKNSLSLTQQYSLQARINEYERNVFNDVRRYQDYLHTIEMLDRNKMYISLETLEKCFSLLYPKFGYINTVHRLKQYIVQSKILQIGNQVPSFYVNDLLDQKIKSDSFYSRYEYTLIDIWASWCIPCREKMAYLKNIYKEIDTSKLQVISISIDDYKNKWVEANKHDSVSWKSYIDQDGFKGNVGKVFNLDFIPKNILIDKSGKIVEVDLWNDMLKEFLKSKSLLKTLK